MIMEMENISGKELSVVKDPFKKDYVTDIAIHYTIGMFSSSTPHWWARVDFKNDNTTGSQKIPDCKTFEEVIFHMKKIIESLK